MNRLALTTIVLTLMSVGAGATEAPPDYFDDRSDASQLIRSYYNAVSRKEYARAWSYLSTKPQSDFAAFINANKMIDAAAVTTGAASATTANNETTFIVPVAVLAFNSDGGDTTFAGCISLRLPTAEPGVERFEPLAIKKIAIKPVSADYWNALPAGCTDSPAPADPDIGLRKAKALFAANDAEQCGTANPVTNEPAYPVERYNFPYRYSDMDQNAPEVTVEVMKFWCDSGAYNERVQFYLYDPQRGIRAASFAWPEISPVWEDTEETILKEMRVIGWSADTHLVNAEFQPATRAIKASSYWRGLGDASDVAVWTFDDGAFRLTSFEIDATFDGKVDLKPFFTAAEAPTQP